MSAAAPTPTRRSRASLWLILALTAAPVAVSYLLYYFWAPARTVNYGELIEPRQLPDVPLALADGSPFRLSQLKGKWVLVSVDSGRCDAVCDRTLLYMRQLRLTQGKEMERVERAWLIPDDFAPRAEAAAAYEGTWQVRASEALVKLFPAHDGPSGHIYVIDPLGNLMMRFPRDPDPRHMIRDLQRLLKASRVG
jgi:cytochrome oxidase Cu insertion factor (SCO1/SenC/PrrC family)